jgi:hypothetical protein
MKLRKTLARAVVPLSLLACAQLAAAQTVQVAKSPFCGCCNQWVEHLRRAGFQIRIVEAEDVTPIARQLGVPDDLRSCHTAVVNGYVIEGHVPAADIRRLLAQRPRGTGLAVPGMPIGSPGMEQGNRRQPYQVILFEGGRRTVFARH